MDHTRPWTSWTLHFSLFSVDVDRCWQMLTDVDSNWCGRLADLCRDSCGVSCLGVTMCQDVSRCVTASHHCSELKNAQAVWKSWAKHRDLWWSPRLQTFAQSLWWIDDLAIALEDSWRLKTKHLALFLRRSWLMQPASRCKRTDHDILFPWRVWCLKL